MKEPFFDRLARIDDVVKRGPAICDLERDVDPLLQEEASVRYFYSSLRDVRWLDLLIRGGRFSRVPPPHIDPERGVVSFPIWPQSGYLARVAQSRPEEVADVISCLPDVGNVLVYEDLADAATAMPAELSAKLTEKAVSWAKSSHQFLLPRKLGILVEHFARGGQVDAALRLTRTLLEALPDPKSRQRVKEHLSPQPTPRFDQWEYKEILDKNVPELVKVAGTRAIELLCDLLGSALQYSRREAIGTLPLDYSWIWRPSIEDHPQNRHHGLRDLLVTSVRDACKSLIRARSINVVNLIGILESDRYPWPVFQRIALHLLRLFPHSALDLIAQRLTNRALFDGAAYQHEYAMLLNDCFGLLPDQQQKIILGWIEEGPNLEEFKKREEEFTGVPQTDDDADRYRKGWQRLRLAWFKEALPREWKDRYEELVAEGGEPEHPAFPSYSRSWVGPASPKSADELQNMTLPEVVSFLRTWKPSGEPMAPSREGLGRVLSSVVSERPHVFSDEAARFQELHPTYVRALLVGLRDAVGKDKAFTWKPVLGLCNWVLEQKRDMQVTEDNGRDEDPHWGWTRKAIVDFLSLALKEDESPLTYEYREEVWRVLQTLTEDPEPTPEYEAESGGTDLDPITASFNTTRGAAMHAVIRYALWVRRHLKKEPDSEERLARGFGEMREVQHVLETRLNTSVESSLAIRAVYGQSFPWLVSLDSTWSHENANRIFPLSEKERPLWHAAWDTYVTHCYAYNYVFEALQDQYALAIDRLDEPSEETDEYESPQVRLGQHLMVFYWRGRLSLDEPNGFLSRFWEKASPAVRGSALEFVGRSLRNTEGDVATEVLDCLKQLWKTRFSEAQTASNRQENLSEMRAFGSWFASGKIDDEWAIKQLLETLRLMKKTDPVHLVVDRLAAISEKMPLEAVQCLEYLAKGDEEGWSIHGWIEEAQTILSNALQCGGKPAELARALIHHLGSRGYLQFRPLLNERFNAN
ncbi:MAG: hypothetical protein SWH78_15790 [Thermodesulfobacteriota bacterium]|nr:hypothetical protein [Thermodesulfobacteriota bacterium]